MVSIPAWDEPEFESQRQKEEREAREKAERAHRLKCEHLRERLANAVELGDDDSVFLVIKAVERDEEIESMAKIIDVTTEDGVGAVFNACKLGHAECARHLIVAGANSGRSTKDGKMTCLFAAASKGHERVIELLLKQRDTRINFQTKDGRTALYGAAESGNKGAVLMLLEAGAAVDIRRKDGSTALIVAAYLGHAEVVEELLKANAKINLRDEDGTALQNAIRQRQTACIELLEKAKKERGHLEAFEEEEDALAVS